VAVVCLVLASFTAGTYFLALAPKSGVAARVDSSNSTGRTDLWRVALKMVEAHPITGVGAGDYPLTAVHYVNKAGLISSAYLIVFQPHVAHDIYLEMAADLGIPGLLVFLALVFGSLAAAVRATRRAETRGDRNLEVLGRCLVLSLVGFMAADVFLSGQFSKQLFLVMAMCPATYALAGTPIAFSEPAPES
jgi:O-antigen ligase